MKHLFITKDNIKIYEGDKYYYVHPVSNYYIGNTIASESNYKTKTYGPVIYEHFSLSFYSYTSAKNWVERNIKKFSEEDILKYLGEKALLKLKRK